MARSQYADRSTGPAEQQSSPRRPRRRAWLIGRVLGLGLPFLLAVVAGMIYYYVQINVSTDPVVGDCLTGVETGEFEVVACAGSFAEARIVGVVEDTRWAVVNDTACQAFPQARPLWSGPPSAALMETDVVLCVTDVEGQ